MKANKKKVYSLIDLGFQVIPVNKDTKGKNLYNFKWSEIIIRDHTLADTYWYGEVDRDIAVLHDEYGVIDVDRKNGKDGYQTLDIHKLELPYTPVAYDTPNNGRHYLYRFPKGTKKSAPIYLGKTRLEGIDRQVGNGIFVWYGDIPSAEVLASVPDAPAWALGLEEQPLGKEYKKILDSLVPGHIEHQDMINAQYAIVSEGAKGNVGHVEAMMELRDLYLAGRWDTPEYQKEWSVALSGLEAKMPEIEAKAKQSTERKEPDFEFDVGEAMYKDLVRETAKKRRMEAIYNGTTAWEWADLENVKVEYILQDLLYKSSMNGLVGRSQIGKTFLIVSMLSCMALGEPWMGLKTEKQRIMYIAGEGTGGIANRFKDWSRAYKKDWEEVKRNIKIVTDVDLYFDLSVEQLQLVSNNFQPDVIVYDTLSANASIENENDAAAMGEILAAAKSVYPDAIVLFVHHPSEATKSLPAPKPRGSSVFYNNADNIMTVTVDKSFSPNTDIPRYTSGKSVQFLTLSTDFEDHGGKSKEGMPLTIKGLYLREFETGRVVLDQTTGSRMHSHNSLIDAVMQYLQDEGRALTIKSLWNGAVELGIKDADDPNGGWKSEKGARNILESAIERGYLVEVPGSGPIPTSYVRPTMPDFGKTWEY